MIYFFYVHTTIRPKYMVLFHLSFLLFTTLRPEFRVFTDLFLLFPHDHSTKIYGSLSFLLSFVHDHSTKIRFLINLWFLFEHDHSTKLGVTLSFYFILFLIVPIFGMLYSWQILPLYFLCSVCGRTALIFRPLFQSSTTLYFMHYIHESAAVTFRTLYPCLYEVFTGPLRVHIKSCHFPERIEARRQYFYFFI